MYKATYIRDLQGWTGKASLYELKPPFFDDDPTVCVTHVIVSATKVRFSFTPDIPDSFLETYIFESDAEGEILNWSELPGSYRGALDHELALNGLGYTTKKAEAKEPDSTMEWF